MANGSERRTSRRFNMSLPVTINMAGNGEPAPRVAETRDISFRGLYFVLDGAHEVGGSIEFVLTLPKEITMAGDVRIRCFGEVVRVEDNAGRRGIAAKIDRYEFLPMSATA